MMLNIHLKRGSRFNADVYGVSTVRRGSR